MHMHTVFAARMMFHSPVAEVVRPRRQATPAAPRSTTHNICCVTPYIHTRSVLRPSGPCLVSCAATRRVWRATSVYSQCHRRGPPGSVAVVFWPRHTHFDNADWALFWKLATALLGYDLCNLACSNIHMHVHMIMIKLVCSVCVCVCVGVGVVSVHARVYRRRPRARVCKPVRKGKTGANRGRKSQQATTLADGRRVLKRETPCLFLGSCAHYHLYYAHAVTSRNAGVESARIRRR